MNDTKAYTLPGGGKVTVFPKSNDRRVYFAIVEMDNCEYPELTDFAQNHGQAEAVYILEGQFSATVNSEIHELSVGDYIYFSEGDKYRIKGSGRCLVAIAPDGDESRTEIVKG